MINRIELKESAKELVRGNKWYILKPLVVIGIIISFIEVIGYVLDYSLGFLKIETIELFGEATTFYSGGIISSIVGVFTGIASCALSIAYAYYILSFVRGQRLELSDVLDFMKKHWVVAFLTSLLIGLIYIAGLLLFVIPAIIAALGLTFYKEVCADNPMIRATEIVRKSWEITRGHKMELFILGLSFLGWNIVAVFTFGILYIWLAPYMTITFTLFYEKLK